MADPVDRRTSPSSQIGLHTADMGDTKVPLLFLLLSLLSPIQSHGPVQYQKQTDYGTYKYGYDTGDQGARSFKQEHRGFDGIVHGRYGYTDANGKLRYVEYTAGPFGFRVKGDNEPSYYGDNGLPISTYKVPTDTELTDLNAGLAKIAKDQLFGVPVQPYVKGYVGSPPPSEVRVEVPPAIVQLPQKPVSVKGYVQPPFPPPVKEIFRQPVTPYVKGDIPPPPVKSLVRVEPPPVIVEVPVQPYLPPPPPRVVVRVKPEGGRPYVKGELPPHRRKIVVMKAKPQIPIQPVVPFVKGYVPPPPPVIFREDIFAKPVPDNNKGYVHIPSPVPQHPPVVLREEIFQKPVPVYTKGYVPPQPPPQVVVREEVYNKGYVPPQPLPPVVVREEVYPRPPPQVVPAYTKGYVPPQPHPQVVIREQVYPEPIPPKSYIPPPQVVVREEVYPEPIPPKSYIPPPRVVVREEVYPRPVPAYTKGYVQPQSPKVVVREEIFAKPVPAYTKGYVPPPVVVREEVIQRPFPVYTKGYVAPPPPPKSIVREEIFRPVAAYVPPPKTIVRQEIFAKPAPAYTKGYVPPSPVIVREELVRRPIHPKGFVPVRPLYEKTYVPPRVVVPASRPQSLYVKGFVTTPRPFAAPIRPAYVPVSTKRLFEVPAPTYSKGYIPEIRRQTKKGTVVTVQRPLPPSPGRRVPDKGDTGDGLRWVPAPENRYRPEARVYESRAYESSEYGPPPAYAYAPY